MNFIYAYHMFNLCIWDHSFNHVNKKLSSAGEL